MNAPRCISLIGLGFGDCGKGLFTDALCRRFGAHTVVRFNGGAQAGHNVVLPDGRHHTFSQFGAASFVPGVATVLASPVVVHPTALLIEADHLRRAGAPDALDRLTIDARCRITTPYHQAAGRLREWQRGAAAHGSCGVGVGETVRHALAHPDEALHYGDLAQPARAADKLRTLRARLAAEFDLAALRHAGGSSDPASATQASAAEADVLADERIAALWLARLAPLLRAVPPASHAVVAERLHRPGVILFEGAQGMLLDEWRGFHPHTSWSSVGPSAVEAVLADVAVKADVRHLGVLRSYLTRHGAGPMPTHDVALDRALAEPHNAGDGWQGAFRRGHPDAVLLDYAVRAAGLLNGLLVSHLDALAPEAVPLRWCDAYQGAEGASVSRLALSTEPSLEHQLGLTQWLSIARPRYEGRALRGEADVLARFEAVAGCPVWAGSRGPTHQALTWFSAAA